MRDKSREDAIVRLQLSIAQQALEEEASAREEMAVAVEELTRVNADLNQALLLQKELFEKTMRELESTYKESMQETQRLHEQQLVCLLIFRSVAYGILIMITNL
jgi:hypothetical protein